VQGPQRHSPEREHSHHAGTEDSSSVPYQRQLLRNERLRPKSKSSTFMVQPAQAPASAGPRCSGIQAQGVHNAYQLFPIYTGTTDGFSVR